METRRRGDTRRGEDGDPEIHRRLSLEAALARQDANHSPRLRSPCLRVSVSLVFQCGRYAIIPVHWPRKSIACFFLRPELAATKVMLKRISDATSQSNIAKFPQASDFHRSHQSHCNFNVILWRLNKLPGPVVADSRAFGHSGAISRRAAN